MTVFVLSRITLMITITAGVVHEKMLYLSKAFLLSSWQDRVCPKWKKKKKKNKDELGKNQDVLGNNLEDAFGYLSFCTIEVRFC